MKLKTVFPLLLLIVFSTVFTASAEETKEVSVSMKSDKTLIVNYFHGKRRCVTCKKLEAYAKEALEMYYPDELKDKSIQWKVTDMGSPENTHFAEDFSLVSQSLLLIMEEKGKRTAWKNLDKIWKLVRDETAYMEYVRDSVKEFMGENNG